MRKDKPIFFCGLGEKTKDYNFLSEYLDIIPIDWNNVKIPKKKIDIAVGFSMGAILACEYALVHKVKKLILCSMTTGVETLKKVKADEIIFVVGEKEKWVQKDGKRLMKDLKCKKRMIIVPKGGHKVDRKYGVVILKCL